MRACPGFPSLRSSRGPRFDGGHAPGSSAGRSGPRCPLPFPSSIAGAALLALSLAACTQPRTTCGDLPRGGGPPRIATKDAELCETVRLRVAESLGSTMDLAPEQIELLRDRTWSWEDADSLDGFLRRVRDDAGESVAASIERAVREVQAHSAKPVRAGCADAERCLVRGAALGARIAFDDAASLLRVIRRRMAGSKTDS